MSTILNLQYEPPSIEENRRLNFLMVYGFSVNFCDINWYKLCATCSDMLLYKDIFSVVWFVLCDYYITLLHRGVGHNDYSIARWLRDMCTTPNRYFTIYCVWWSVLAAGMQIHAKWFKAELRIPFNVPRQRFSCNSLEIAIGILFS